MGATKKYPFPKHVWSPSGGWWCVSPPNWQRNTAICALTMLCTIIPLWRYSNQLIESPMPTYGQKKAAREAKE
eukprot:CFRG2361T1